MTYDWYPGEDRLGYISGSYILCLSASDGSVNIRLETSHSGNVRRDVASIVEYCTCHCIRIS